MSRIPVSEKSWKKIVYWSHKNTGVRVAMLTWIAVYLLCYHSFKSFLARKVRQRLATAMAFAMAIASFGTSPISLYAKDDETETLPYQLNVELISGPEDEVLLDEENRPEYIFQVTNTGANTLTELSFATASFDLLWVETKLENPEDPDSKEIEIRHEIDQPREDTEDSEEDATEDSEIEDSEDGNETEETETEETESEEANTEEVEIEDSETEEQEGQDRSETMKMGLQQNALKEIPGVDMPLAAGEEEPILPTTLEPGQSIRIVAALADKDTLTEGESKHLFTDILSISARELEDVCKVDLSVNLVSQLSKDVDSNEEAASENIENTEATEVTETTEILNNTENDETTEEVTEDSESQEKAEEETPQNKPAELDNPIPASASFVVLSRGDGFFMGDTFYGKETLHYEIKVTDGRDFIPEKFVYYLNDKRYSITIVDHRVSFDIPLGTDAKLRMGYYDGDDTDVMLLEEYVVCEADLLQVDQKRVLDKEQYGLVKISENGEIKSGINELQITVDGEVCSDYSVLDSEYEKLVSEKEVLVSETLRLDLEVGTHQIEVYAVDNCGNGSLYSYEITMIDNEIISVVLPTTFKIEMFPIDTEEQIVSDSIVFCNRSDFPVQVNITRVEVTIDKSMPENATVSTVVDTNNNAINDLSNIDLTNIKTCQMDFHLLQKDGSDFVVPLQEGLNENLTSFILKERNEETQADVLIADKNLDRVESEDYALVKLRGNMGEGSENYWEDEDLKVQIVYHISKVKAE